MKVINFVCAVEVIPTARGDLSGRLDISLQHSSSRELLGGNKIAISSSLKSALNQYHPATEELYWAVDFQNTQDLQLYAPLHTPADQFIDQIQHHDSLDLINTFMFQPFNLNGEEIQVTVCLVRPKQGLDLNDARIAYGNEWLCLPELRMQLSNPINELRNLKLKNEVNELRKQHSQLWEIAQAVTMMESVEASVVNFLLPIERELKLSTCQLGVESIPLSLVQDAFGNKLDAPVPKPGLRRMTNTRYYYRELALQQQKVVATYEDMENNENNKFDLSFLNDAPREENISNAPRQQPQFVKFERRLK